MIEYSEILSSTFSFLEQDDIEEICIALKQEFDESLFAKAQMQKFAQVLDSFGLRITSTLLLGICRKGSKSDAIIVARESARSRYTQSRDQRREKMRAMINNTNQSDLMPIHVEHQASSEKFDQMAADIKHIAQHMKWMVSTIDSERQLTRYKLGQQSGPSTVSHTVGVGLTPKKEMVSAVVSQMAEQYRNAAARIETPDPTNAPNLLL